MQRLGQAIASGEYHIALCGQQAFCERLLTAPIPRSRAVCNKKLSVIVTGGTKGLGLEFAKNRLQSGAQVAVLASRDAVLVKEQLAKLAEGGKAVFCVSCDASQVKALTEVVVWARQWLPAVQVLFCYPYVKCCLMPLPRLNLHRAHQRSSFRTSLISSLYLKSYIRGLWNFDPQASEAKALYLSHVTKIRLFASNFGRSL